MPMTVEKLSAMGNQPNRMVSTGTEREHRHRPGLRTHAYELSQMRRMMQECAAVAEKRS